MNITDDDDNDYEEDTISTDLIVLMLTIVAKIGELLFLILLNSPSNIKIAIQ